MSDLSLLAQDVTGAEPRPTPTAPQVSPMESIAKAIVGTVYNPENPSGLHRAINAMTGQENPPQQRLDAAMPQGPGRGVGIGTMKPSMMKARDINAEMDRLDTISSELTNKLISEGGELSRMGVGDIARLGLRPDAPPLAKAWAALSQRFAALRSEIRARYGPGAPHRLPTDKRGFFGPTESAHE